MKIRQIAVSLIFFLGVGAAHAEAPSLIGHWIYEDPQRMSSYTFSNGLGIDAPIPPKIFRNGADSDSMEGLTPRVYDCSNKKYVCVKGWYSVFAVPRSGLFGEQIYQVSGATFKIEECLRKSNRRCLVAIISSRCDLIGDNGTCLISKNRPEKNPGPITYFIYNIDYGVTAFGRYPFLAESESDLRLYATSYILKGEHGILYNSNSNADMPK